MGRAGALLRSVLPFLVGIPLLLALQAALDATGRGDVSLILIAIGVNVVLAVSLNVVNGFTGQFSLGHAGFMAVGAYTAAKVSLALHGGAFGLPPALADHAVFAVALSCGMATSALAGLLVGMPSLRLRGDYLAIVTLGFGEIIRSIIVNSRFLGQATGLQGLPRLTNVTWAGAAAIAAGALVFTVLSRVVWLRSIARYTSASS